VFFRNAMEAGSLDSGNQSGSPIVLTVSAP
jgi:hypothetical protein